MFNILVNDQVMQIGSDKNLFDLVRQWQYASNGIAIAVNQTFIPQSQWEKVYLKCNDEVDIVAPMQGG